MGKSTKWVAGFGTLVLVIATSTVIVLAPFTGSSSAANCGILGPTPSSGEKVWASQYGGPNDPSSGHVGAAGVTLDGKAAFAELSTNAGAHLNWDFSALGKLPMHALLRITNPATGITIVAEKLDVGRGGPTHPRIDLWYQTAEVLGFHGLGSVVLSAAQPGDTASLAPLTGGAPPPVTSPNAKGDGSKVLATTNPSTSSGCGSGGTNDKVEGAIDAGMTQLGVPYVWGGESPGSAFDCSGLTQWAYAQVGITIPRVAADQYNIGTRVTVDQLQRGDLVFWTYKIDDPSQIHHVAIYLGNGKILAAPHTGTVVQVEPIYNIPDIIGGVRLAS